MTPHPAHNAYKPPVAPARRLVSPREEWVGVLMMNSPGHNGDPPFGAGGSHDDWFGPGDDGPGTGSAVFTVPDDISELDAEVRQYRREVRRTRRRARLKAAVLGPFRWCGRAARAMGRGFMRMCRFIVPW